MDPALQTTRYINFTTFRRDGRATRKLKVAPSDIRENSTGAWSEGTGCIVDEPALSHPANQAIAKKYGLQHYLIQVTTWIMRRHSVRVVIELTV